MIRIGHRGAAAYAAENTILSIKKAIEIGVDFVEIDVQASSDGVIVLMHDKRVDRTTDGIGYVRELPWGELCKLRNLENGESIPRLEDALQEVRGHAHLMIELIDPSIVTHVITLVKQVSVLDEVLLASFHHKAVLAARTIAPKLRTLALMEAVPVLATAFAHDARCTHVGLSIDSITKEFVDELQETGLEVFAYTANDARDIEWLRLMGVDGIVSDRPDMIERNDFNHKV